jgi:hypothetical protein
MPENTIQQQLFRSVEIGDETQTQALIAAGADVNFRGHDPDGETPLIRAVCADQPAIVRLLLKAGAEVNCPGRVSGRTPLMLAVGNPLMMTELIAGGAELEIRTPVREIVSASGKQIRQGGETALHLAAAANDGSTIRMLVGAGAQLESKAENGLTPLDYAIRKGNITEAAEALVEGGAELTTQRLEMMHAVAHSPDSDLAGFSLPAPEEAISSTETLRRQSAACVSGTESQEQSRCPRCHALIYSRKERLCGQCGMPLPDALPVANNQADNQAEERRWATELASKFGGPGSVLPAKPGRPITQGAAAEVVLPKSLLRSISCAQEYSHRDRPAFPLYLVGYAFIFAAVAFFPLKMGALPFATLLPLVTVFAFICFSAWHRASPICPNCKQNIRMCASKYCHICGKLLKSQRCEECGIDNSGPRSFGYFRWIAHCPNCGVYLNAKVRRSRVRVGT